MTSSEALKKLLTYVLRLSKELDDRRSTPRKNTGGFRLHSLLKLADTKAFDRETSALDYVVSMMVANDDEATLHVFDELPGLKAAQRASMAHCQREVKNLQHGLSRITQLIEACGDNDDDQACADACSAFRDLATGALQGLEADVDAASDAFRETLSYLREADQTPEEFFSTLTAFEAKFTESRKRCAHRQRAEQRRRDEERRRPSAERRIEAKLSRRESAPVLHSPKQKRTGRNSSTGALPQNAALEAMLQRRQPRSRSSPADSPPPPPPLTSALAGRVRDRGVARGRVAAAGSVVAGAAGHAALPAAAVAHAPRDDAAERRLGLLLRRGRPRGRRGSGFGALVSV